MERLESLLRELVCLYGEKEALTIVEKLLSH